MTDRHANPRFYVGPNTKEFTIPIARSYDVGSDISDTSVVIAFSKRPVNSVAVSLWTSYAVSEGVAKFMIPEEFRTDVVNFPKGFYDGQVEIDGCIIGDVELIKAPGHYLSVGESIEHKCHGEQTWVEPECPVESETNDCGCSCNGDPLKSCCCSYEIKNNCFTCYNQVVVAKIGSIVEYAGLDEIQECPAPEGAEEDECDPDTDTCVSTSNNKPLVSSIQKSTIKEGYLENESDC